jgi:hypothetical protein
MSAPANLFRESPKLKNGASLSSRKSRGSNSEQTSFSRHKQLPVWSGPPLLMGAIATSMRLSQCGVAAHCVAVADGDFGPARAGASIRE